VTIFALTLGIGLCVYGFVVLFGWVGAPDAAVTAGVALLALGRSVLLDVQKADR
jgi:hypothetical protein